MSFDAAFQVVRSVVDQGRIPGAAFGCLAVDGDARTASAGFASFVPERRVLTRNTLFDLASLTKVILTTPVVIGLRDGGHLDLDAPLARYLDTLGGAAGTLTARQCLAHATGLPATAPLETWAEKPNAVRAMVLAHDWTLGEKVYSDINFILLGLLIETVMRQQLDAALVPGDFRVSPGPLCDVAATEFSEHRGRVLVGEVHDESAFALGGLAGHAGLFARLDAVLEWVRKFMSGEIVPQSTLNEITSACSDTRALGWQLAYPGWSGGGRCSSRTIGHTGYTGTGLWIDLERGVGWVLLTNRVHPSRSRFPQMSELRHEVGTRLFE